jgi:hypothetical protein
MSCWPCAWLDLARQLKLRWGARRTRYLRILDEDAVLSRGRPVPLSGASPARSQSCTSQPSMQGEPAGVREVGQGQQVKGCHAGRDVLRAPGPLSDQLRDNRAAQPHTSATPTDYGRRLSCSYT